MTVSSVFIISSLSRGTTEPLRSPDTLRLEKKDIKIEQGCDELEKRKDLREREREKQSQRERAMTRNLV